MSVEVSLGIIAICMLVITAYTVAVAIALTLFALRLRKSVTTMTNRVQPLIAQATETVKIVNGVAQSVKDHAEAIMDKAEKTVDNVAQKIKTTTSIIQESISPPIITIASFMTGVSRGLEVLSQVRKRGGDGHARGQS